MTSIRPWQRLVLTCVLFAAVGCGGREYKGAKRYSLSGKVTVNGELVDAGTIAFMPVGGDHRVSGGGIENGVYAVPEAQGANAGKYRVEIHWHKKTGKKYRDPALNMLFDERAEGLPPKFHEHSELTVEVSDKQSTFDFDLQSESLRVPRGAESKARISLD